MTAPYWFILIGLGTAFGSSFALNEVLLAAYGPLTVSALRVALGALGSWTWILATGRRVHLGGTALFSILAFGVFQYAAPFAVLPLAQEHVTSSVAGIANAMTPVAVVLISHVWRGGERATPAKLVGVAFGFSGIVVIALQGAEAGTSEPLYVFVAIAAPCCYGVALNLARRFRGLDPAVLTACAMTGGAIAVLPVAFAAEGVPALPTPGLAVALAGIGFGLTSVTFLIMYSILPRVGAVNLSLVTFIAPVSATLIGAAAFGEAVEAGHVVGIAAISAGLAAIDGRIWKVLGRVARRLPPPAQAGLGPASPLS